MTAYKAIRTLTEFTALKLSWHFVVLSAFTICVSIYKTKFSFNPQESSFEFERWMEEHPLLQLFFEYASALGFNWTHVRTLGLIWFTSLSISVFVTSAVRLLMCSTTFSKNSETKVLAKLQIKVSVEVVSLLVPLLPNRALLLSQLQKLDLTCFAICASLQKWIFVKTYFFTNHFNHDSMNKWLCCC